MTDWESDIQICQLVEASGRPNFQGCRIELATHFNLVKWKELIFGYADQQVVELLRYGFPISFEGELHISEEQHITNHRGAVEFSDKVDRYLETEIKLGAVMGPFDTSPFDVPCKLSPLNTVEKKDSEDRRVILDLSFPAGQSVNEGIDKKRYLGESIVLKFPSVDAFAALIFKKGQGCVMFKRDLKRAYRQIRVCPGDVRKLGYRWKGKIYLDKVVSMGLPILSNLSRRIRALTLWCTSMTLPVPKVH